MIIKGILKESVTVEVSREKLFLALAKELGIGSLFEKDYGEYSVLKDIETNEGIKHAIITYEDVSHHGSPYYTETHREVLTETQYECAKAMVAIKENMKKENLNKEI